LDFAKENFSLSVDIKAPGQIVQKSGANLRKNHFNGKVGHVSLAKVLTGKRY